MKFTGVKDIDLYILQSLEDENLVKLCLVNKYFNILIRDGKFWRQRIHLKLNRDFEDIDIIRSDMKMKFKELYIFLKESDLKFDLILNEIENNLIKNINSYTYIMESYSSVFKYMVNFPNKKIYINSLIEKVIRMAKEKEDLKRRIIYTIFTSLWKKSIMKLEDFMELTK